jgi:hypothetical protein
VEQFPAHGSALRVGGFLFESRRVSVAVPEVIAICLGLLEAVAQVPVVGAEYRFEAQPAEADLSFAADPVLRGIYESDLRRIPVMLVELVEVFVLSVRSMFHSNRFCLPCLLLSTGAETKLQRQSAARKGDDRD